MQSANKTGCVALFLLFLISYSFLLNFLEDYLFGEEDYLICEGHSWIAKEDI